MDDLDISRASIRAGTLRDEDELLAELIELAEFPADLRKRATELATTLVSAIRTAQRPSLMEVFLAEYGLSTDEGIALMCLAEALLRVPDAPTVDALIEDKIAPSEWGKHLGRSSSSLVNASTWALMLTGRVLSDGEGMTSVLKSAVRRLGEPVIRAAVQRAIKELGEQFVLGETIDKALDRAHKAASADLYSFDMLGEAALTARDSEEYFKAYAAAIGRLAAEAGSSDVHANSGISVKLSALHPRYEMGQSKRVLKELGATMLALSLQAKSAGIGLNIDAEEASRLDLSLSLIETLLANPDLAGWDGLGVVVQTYGKRAHHVLDWLYALVRQLDRRISVRLVKGAYWDTEIKQAQVNGLDGFPVYTNKDATDVAYLYCAQKLLGMTDRIYP
ncbi:MAG: proline dehydrogenase family protein, partial [Alphaproteobacteria bacterium]